VSGRGRLVAYVGSTAIAGLVAFVWALPQVDPRAALLVMAAVFVAELTASTFRDEVTASLTNVIVPVAMIVGGTPLAIVAALGAVPAFALRASDMRVLRTVFNGGQYVLAAAAGGLVYETLLQLSGSEFPHWVSLIAVLAAAIVHNVVNHASVAGIVAILLKDDFLATFRSIGPSIALQVPYAGIAILAALLVESLSVWALLFMAVPPSSPATGCSPSSASTRPTTGWSGFVKAIEIKDLYTRGHSERVASCRWTSPRSSASATRSGG
jgi:hypothetical protein